MNELRKKAMEHPRLFSLVSSPTTSAESLYSSTGAAAPCPFVFSTTLSHLIANNSAHLLLPFVSIRERLTERWRSSLATSTRFLLNSLCSWHKGSSIGWHSDDNRPYLKQRHFAAVCYLNSCGKDFQGGDFHFQDGEPKTIVPTAGDVLTFTADSRNVYSVDETIAGERSTLTLWFTLDCKHDEDAKRLMLLSSNPLTSLAGTPDSYCPLPAPDDMYRFCTDSFPDPWKGFDIRSGRISTLGCSLCTCGDDDNMDFITNRTNDSQTRQTIAACSRR